MPRGDAFDAFYRDAHNRVLHQVYAVTGTIEGARECVADAFVAAAHHWRKVELDPARETWVRQRAFESAHRNRVATRMAYDDRTPDASRRLFEALRTRREDDRHLVVAHLVAGLDLSTAAREAGLTDDAARRSLDGTEAAVREAWIDLDAASLATRLNAVREDLHDVPFQPPKRLRREGNRRRRSHIVLAGTAALALAIGAGALTAAKPQASAVTEAEPGTPMLTTPSASPPETFEQPDFTTDQLMPLDEVAALDPDATWRITDTSADFGHTRPLHPCLTMIPSDPKATHVWLRQVETARKQQPTSVTQLLEVSKNDKRADASYDRLVAQLATCPRGGYEVTDFGKLRGIGTDSHYVRLAQATRRGVEDDQLVISRTGRATVVWLVQAPEQHRVSDRRLSALLYDSVNWVCGYSDGRCASQRYSPQNLTPPPARRTAGFLSAVDMPVLPGLPDPWVATPPQRTRSNPAATECDRSDFRAEGATGLRYSDFVVPTAEKLSDIFGMTQSVGEFRTTDAARDFVRGVRRAVATCNDRQLSLEVRGDDSFEVPRGSGEVWEISVGTSEQRALMFRTALVRVGTSVTQLTFTGSRSHDLSTSEYVDLARRAVARLNQA
ncbi:MAG: RNA polymerase sigma factor [Nocardioidaceae bacterium]